MSDALHLAAPAFDAMAPYVVGLVVLAVALPLGLFCGIAITAGLVVWGLDVWAVVAPEESIDPVAWRCVEPSAPPRDDSMPDGSIENVDRDGSLLRVNVIESGDG